jgi:ubiquinol-cytochrome c reductase cytochrome b subunit/cytochrome b6
MKATEQAPQRKGFLAYLGELVPVDWEILRHAGAEPVPHHLKRWWFALGGTPLYYVPSPEFAYGQVNFHSLSAIFLPKKPIFF